MTRMTIIPPVAPHAALYARVSSERQATTQTIASQVSALRERVAADGYTLGPEDEFLDDGYSGATLIRPALEQLRDVIAAGGVDRVYVHSPDRLARKYAYQVLLLEEFQRHGVEVVFLNRAVGESPEDSLLVQVQGMVAEYERAKILERSRRGKRHAATQGIVSVLGGAPYGFRYITKHDGGGAARYEIHSDEADVVRQIFTWVGRDRDTIGAVTRRLQEHGIPSPHGKSYWDRTTVWGLLKNPAYMGTAAYGKTQCVPLTPRLRAQRGRSLHPKVAASVVDVAPTEWLTIPVPAIVEPALFATVQEQLAENRKHARARHRGGRHLLQGLVVCARCGYAYYGKPVSPASAHGKPRRYIYYRCIGTDAYRFGGIRVCSNTQVNGALLDQAVWHEVRQLLEQPDRILQEYQRRLDGVPATHTATMESLTAQGQKLKTGIARVIDSYTDGLLTKAEFEPRLGRLRERLTQCEAQLRDLTDAAARQADLTLVIGQLETFAAQVRDRLETLDWTTRRDLIRTLVKRVEIDAQAVRVVFRLDDSQISPGDRRAGEDRPAQPILPDCGKHHLASASVGIT